jgi:hypothetical protein
VYRWMDWNRDHATRHGVSVNECERLVNRGRARRIGDNKYRVTGKESGGRWIQVIYAFDEESGDVFVIHARPLTEQEKKRAR